MHHLVLHLIQGGLAISLTFKFVYAIDNRACSMARKQNFENVVTTGIKPVDASPPLPSCSGSAIPH